MALTYSPEEQALRDMFQLGKIAGYKECESSPPAQITQPIVLTPVCRIHEEIFLVRSESGNSMYCPVCQALQGVEEQKAQAHLQAPLHGQQSFGFHHQSHLHKIVLCPLRSSLQLLVSECETITEMSAVKAA